MEVITDPRDAGKFIRERIKEKGMLIKDVAEKISADPSYMSHLLSGRVSVADSDYFGPLVRLLDLSVEEIRSLKPEAVVEISARPLSAAAQGYRIPRPARPIPEALQEAARLYGHLPAFEGLTERRWQEFMTNVSRHRTPTTAEEWMQEFAALKKMGYDPQESDE